MLCRIASFIIVPHLKNITISICIPVGMIVCKTNFLILYCEVGFLFLMNLFKSFVTRAQEIIMIKLNILMIL